MTRFRSATRLPPVRRRRAMAALVLAAPAWLASGPAGVDPLRIAQRQGFFPAGFGG